MATRTTVGVGIVGAGVIGRFPTRSWQGVRDGDVVATVSRTASPEQRRRVSLNEGFDESVPLVARGRRNPRAVARTLADVARGTRS
jgi:ornithine cyclodeaminase/alanine dehydrogenase-like protein (mu-crystallin family)